MTGIITITYTDEFRLISNAIFKRNWSYRESCILSVVIGIKVLLKFQHTEFHFFQESIRHNLWKKVLKSDISVRIAKIAWAGKCETSHRVCINKECRAFRAWCQHLRRPQKFRAQPSQAIAKITHSIRGQGVKLLLNRLQWKKRVGDSVELLNVAVLGQTV